MKPYQDAPSLPDITLLTQDEVRRLCAVITSKRDRALVQLAYHHGLRASAVSLFQRDDVHAKQGRIDIPRVKGSLANTSPLQPDDLRCLRASLQTRDDDAPSLLISTRGIPLKRRSYGDLMPKHGQVAAIPKSQRWLHALRHAIAVPLLDAGAAVAFVQDRFGARSYPEHDGVHALHHSQQSAPVDHGRLVVVRTILLPTPLHSRMRWVYHALALRQSCTFAGIPDPLALLPAPPCGGFFVLPAPSELPEQPGFLQLPFQ